MAHTIPASSLTPNTTISVRGTIAFSRVTRFLTPDEMVRDRQRRQQYGRQVIDKPYTTITLKNPALVRANPNAPLDNNERYMEECFYQKKAQNGQAPDNTRYYNIDNKSPRLPHIYQYRKNADGSFDTAHLVEVTPTAELDNGLDVILVLRIYKPNGFANCGIALDSIIVQGEVRYYSGGATAALAGLGYTVDKSLTDAEREAASAQSARNAAPAMDNYDQGADVPDITQPMASAPVATPTPGTDYYAAQVAQPAPAPAQVPNQNPVPTPAPAPAPAAPAQATPMQNDTWTCSCGAVNTGNFCNNCGAKKPQAATNAYANANAVGQTPTGIVFDPNDNNRNY